jgi:mono/diheme cytochrome c family protein
MNYSRTYSNIVFPGIVFAAAILLTAFLATASLRAAGAPAERFLLGGVDAGGGAEQLKAPPTPAGLTAQQIRVKYLVDIMGCHDCHTPMKMGPKGPEWDLDRALSGHPENLAMPAAPALPPGPWIGVAAATFTAWSGPWGTSFTANLTPDKETGLGDWTEEMFIATMKTGRHQGKGRPLLPPMPYFNLQKLTDEDIKSVFAYLQSLTPIHNKVPAPIDPEELVQ